MSTTFSQILYYCEIDGVAVPLQSPVVQNESFESQTWVADFQLAARPASEPAEGDTVEIMRIRVADDEGDWQFAGYVQDVETESEPWSMHIRANGELDKFNVLREGTDLNLTGDDAGVWMAVADYCGVIYDAADIQNAGFNVAEREALKWKIGTPGWSVIQELDDVLGMRTIEIGHGRVIRFAYDLAPDGSTHHFEYEKGVTATFWKHSRRAGRRSERMNRWKITGVSIDCDDGDTACTCQVWAKATDTGSRKARRHRRQTVPFQEFSSDFIQSEDAAEAIARRFMRWYNRSPDEISIDVLNDSTARIGHVVKITDSTYGIGASPAKYYMIWAIDRTGDAMTLHLVGGAEGSEGTVTTGVQKQCNEALSDINWPGTFDLPDFAFPDLELSITDLPGAGIDVGGATTPVVTFFGPVIPVGGDCSAVVPAVADWILEFGDIDFLAAGELSMTDINDAQAYHDDADTCLPLTDEITFRWVGSVDRTGTSEVFIQFFLGNALSTVNAGIEILFAGSGDLVNFYDFSGFAGDDGGGAIPDTFTFELIFAAGDMTFLIDGTPRATYSYGTWPAAEDLYPRISHGSAVTMSFEMASIEFQIGV